VSLVAILDADKEGYLRSATSLIQTIGRCARHVNGRAILYADRMTASMEKAIGETARRRAKQSQYNLANGITPQSVLKSVDMQLASIVEADYMTVPTDDYALENIADEAQLAQAIAKIEAEMREAAKKFEFERAAALRDRVRALKQRDMGELFAKAGVLESAEPQTGPTERVAPSNGGAEVAATPEPVRRGRVKKQTP
jgi:excinuclease ABC subunit B